MCFDFLYNFWVILKRNSVRYVHKYYIGLHVKCPLFLSDFKETWIFSTDFLEKNLHIKFHQKPSSRSPVVPCGRTDRQTHRQRNRNYGTNSHFSKFFERAYKFNSVSLRNYSQPRIKCGSLKSELPHPTPQAISSSQNLESFRTFIITLNTNKRREDERTLHAV